ncbi:MAG TPA: HAD-IIIA family hydrolase [Ktedonobacteraceae bacterium]|jgi:HAD superfamily hydrolase (TIGR01662 family)|nr:HAD-IIIA family hydrolase [Ktedonobacteraceae bacterium]
MTIGIDISVYELFLTDLDGTLVLPVRGKTFPETVGDRRIMSDRHSVLDELHAQGKKVCIITNQGGRAWDIFSNTEFEAWMDQFCARYNIDGYQVCYHDTGKASQLYPEKIVLGLGGPDLTPDGFERRKPGPGMLIQAMQHFGVSKERTLMIGDRHEDEGAAAAAGVLYVPAWKFFGDPEPSPF